MNHSEGPGCGCSSCLEMYPAPEPCKNCKRLLVEVEAAYKAGHLRGNRYIVGMADQSEREDDWLAWAAKEQV